ncbi:nucleolar and coiled-body phosphoprotein 1 [Rhinichthys klamathensis goyatoka]|uniref:nucleolar and coiled-body phosphoprotein 1 n=1 Tax=Rhinichthys klamathensis goyatoka TaxID=3034132 RepID=UPI0024B5DFD0|nr:nucleolar and coiled-body phosphoprotein 1 [Rhinichthys klamathensis goyatoka]
MTSNITDATQDELINLIYHHLKDNGYQKAAHVLKKHAPKLQVEAEEVKVSLSEIFQKWASSDDGDTPPVPSGVQTPELQSPAKTQRGSSKITAPSAGLDPKKPVGNITTAGTAGKSTKQRKNETGSKPRKRNNSSSEEAVVPPSAADPGNDSDSDSSLDVDKWRRLLSEFSDVDREKMDVLSILDESFGKIPERSRANRKPRTKKKVVNQSKEGKSDTPENEAAAKSDDISVTTDASKNSEKTKDEDTEAPKVKKKTGNKKNSSISGLDVVETPKRTKAKTTNTSCDQDETDKAEHHETNGLLKGTKEVGVSDSEAIWTPKRVHFEPLKSFSHQVVKNACKDNGTSETSTPAKTAKKKKGLSEASDVETDNNPSNTQEVKKAAVETHCEETNLTTDQSETPSKKVKNKKSKSVAEPVPNETPAKKGKAKKTEVPSEIDQETTSESVNPDSSSKKAKHKASESLSETLESEKPAKKAKRKTSESILETTESEKPAKKAKCKASESISETLESETASKKAKHKASESLSEAPESETASKKAKHKTSESISETIESEKPAKKAKCKTSESISETLESETASKKAKHKASESLSEAPESETASKKAKHKTSESISETLESEKPAKKAKCKTSESISETIESEKPAKKAKAVKEPGEVETSSKKPKTVPSDADLLQFDSANRSLKKKKSKMAADSVEIQPDVPAETPVKSLQSQKNDVADGLGNEETSGQELNTLSKKQKKHKTEEACDVPAAPEAKKVKAKSKNKKGENADALQPPPPEEEEEEEAAVSQKKKKKKRGEETEGIVPVSAPVEELVVQKKKKKKEKALVDSTAHNETEN